MSLPWRPRFEWGPAGDREAIRLRWPVGLWRDQAAGIGGGRHAADGTLGAWLQAERDRLSVPVRFDAAEWPAIRALLEWAQTGAAFTWSPDPDADPAIAAVEVLLDAPRAGEAVDPLPDVQYPKLRTLTLLLRRADGLRFDLEYFSGLGPGEAS